MRMRVLLCVLAAAVILPAQETAPAVAFEAVSIKPTPPAPDGGVELPRLRQNPAGIDYDSVSLFTLLLKAYKVESYQLSAPAGLDLRWNIQARSPTNATLEQIPQMLQSLLADRFGVKVHHESREVSGYALIVAKDGPRLVAAKPPGTGLGAGPSPLGGRRLKGQVQLSVLAQTLSYSLGRALVVDMTGLPGIYDISVDYTPDQPADSAGAPPPAGPGMVEAVQQALGLKLERRKLTVDMLVVDHAEPRPTGN